MSDFQTPLIFDESFDSSSLIDAHFSDQFAEGLLAKTGAFMSMPAYEKQMPPDVLDYHTTGALHDPTQFGAFAQPHYPHLLLPSDFSGTGQDSDFPYAASADFAQQHNFALHRPSVIDVRTRQAPEFTSFTSHGLYGGIFRLYFQSDHDFFAPPSILFSLLFGNLRVEALTRGIGDLSGPLRQYEVSAEIPAFMATGWHSFTVPMRLNMESPHTNAQPHSVEIGSFTYNSIHPGASNSRKRKASTGSEFDLQPPTKKIPNPQLQLQDRTADSYDYNQPSPYSPFLSTPTTGVTQQTQVVSPRPNGHHYSTSSASQVSMTAPSPHTPAWSPSFTTVKSEHSPHPPMTPAPRPSSTVSALKPTVPKLVRTSTIQHSPPGVTGGNGAVHNAQFNPYSMYPHKANLKLHGDLDALAKDWSSEELDARRRLIEFSRTQNGSTIDATFKPVAPEDRVPNNITISCIYWKEKKECFVTSVDTIYLLEALVGVRFTVEEKNRIRRNLEGFRPLTVSKAKGDSEEFFKVIMGFPHPKPRNIEKDVKVFPWRILSQALKKIIGKYSASYSSTASAILTPSNSAYASTEASTEDYITGGPSEYVNNPYQPVPSVGYPGPEHINMSAPVTTVGMDLRLQMPTIAPEYSLPGNFALQNIPQHPQSMAPIPQTMSAPASVRMPTWDFSNFVNDSPATMAPSSASAVAYPRGSIDTADFVTPPKYSTSK